MKKFKFISVLALSLVLVYGSVQMCFAKNINVDIVENGNDVKLVFSLNGKTYELNLNPSSGQVSGENVNSNSSTGNVNGTNITLEEAKNIALKHSGLSNVYFTKAKLDYENGKKIYEIEFVLNGKEYEYEIDANNGSILKFDVDYDNNYQNNYYGNHHSGNGYHDNYNNYQSGSDNLNASLTKNEAENIALGNAGVSRENVKYIKSELDRDDGYLYYEVEFKAGNMEYEYKINANNGNIVEKDMDYDD